MKIEKLNEAIDTFEAEYKNIINYSKKLQDLTEIKKELESNFERIELNTMNLKRVANNFSNDVEKLKKRNEAIYLDINDDIKKLERQVSMNIKSTQELSKENDNILNKLSDVQQEVENKIIFLKEEMRKNFKEEREKRLKIQKNFIILGAIIVILNIVNIFA